MISVGEWKEEPKEMSAYRGALQLIHSIERAELWRGCRIALALFGVLTLLAWLSVFVWAAFWFLFAFVLLICAVAFLLSRDRWREIEKDLVSLRKVFGEPSVSGFIEFLRSPVTFIGKDGQPLLKKTYLEETAASKFCIFAIEALRASSDPAADSFLQEFCKEDIRIEERDVPGGLSNVVQGGDHCYDPGGQVTLTIHSFPNSNGVLPEYFYDRETPIHKAARAAVA